MSIFATCWGFVSPQVSSFVLSPKSNEIGSSCLEPPAVQARLNFYASMFAQRLTSGHYTLHGFRSGAAVSAFVKLWIMLVE